MTDFGGRLRLARERRGVSLRQIAASTKISVAALEALERNDLSRLPGGIFIRAFVRSYALEVGLDPDETVREFLEHFQQEGAGAEPAGPAGRADRSDGHPGIQAKRDGASGFAGATHSGRSLDDEGAFESRQRMASVLVKIIVASFVAGAVILYLSRRQPAGAPRQAPADTPATIERAPSRGATIRNPWTPDSAPL